MEPPPASRLAFDDIVIDVAGRRLLRGGGEQPLEPKAFAVLALLAGAPGRVHTRDEILDAVWGHRHVTPGVLNRVMTLLRHALGEEANAPRYLRTVHGVGYRFDLPATTKPQVESPGQASVPLPEAPSPGAAPETPSPIPPQRRRDDGAAPARKPSRRIALWTLPLLALLAFAGWRLWPRATPAAAATTTSLASTVPAMERSVAVLPLVNASNDPGQQFFSDGLSDNLIDVLSKFEGLRVIGRNSAFQFRDSQNDSAAIGRKLGVAYLLGGSVQHVGDVVRINAALTKADDGSTVWAEHYDRPYKDLFALQDEIASAVAGALQARLLSASVASKQDDRPPGGSIDAYSAYLQGLKHWHDEDWPKAAEYMARASQLDPGYAMAWAHLSGSLSTTAMFEDKDPAVAREYMRQSRLAADKALQLAPGLGAAHAARAYLLFYSFDPRGALAECRRAVQLAPDNGTVLNGCGYVLAGIGKLGEALHLRERLRTIEPLYNINNINSAELLMATGQLDEAAKYVRIAEGLLQSKSSTSYKLSYKFMYVAIARGDMKTAQDIARSQPPPWREMNLAITAQVSPDRAAADAALEKILANKTWAETDPYLVAQAYALRGDRDKSMEWLQRARTGHLLFMLADPIILRFRDDPRLIAFCKKIGLPSPGESEALGLDQIRALQQKA